LERGLEGELTRALHESLKVGLASLPEIGLRKSPELRVPAETIVSYLENFKYVISPDAEESIAIFRDLAARRLPEITLVGM
jgi:hypothetical protein